MCLIVVKLALKLKRFTRKRIVRSLFLYRRYEIQPDTPRMSEDSSAQLPDTINDADNELFLVSPSSSVSMTDTLFFFFSDNAHSSELSNVVHGHHKIIK